MFLSIGIAERPINSLLRWLSARAAAHQARYQKAERAVRPRVLDANGEWEELEEAGGFQLTYGMFYEGYKGPRQKVWRRCALCEWCP
eukprot:1175388-Prorocentrum_minimum.AAC.1